MSFAWRSSHAARLLARQHSKEDLRALSSLCDRIEKAAGHGNLAEVSRLDKDFHEQLCRRAGSPRLFDVFQREVLQIINFMLHFGDIDAEAYAESPNMGGNFGLFSRQSRPATPKARHVSWRSTSGVRPSSSVISSPRKGSVAGRSLKRRRIQPRASLLEQTAHPRAIAVPSARAHAQHAPRPP